MLLWLSMAALGLKIWADFQAVRTLSDAKAASPQFASWLTRQAEKIGSGSWTGGSSGFGDTRGSTAVGRKQLSLENYLILPV